MTRTTQIIGSVGSAMYGGSGTQYVVQSNAGSLYIFTLNSAIDLSYTKSTDNGATWADAVTVFAGSITNFAIWFDRWSSISAGLIHVAYTELGGSNTNYVTVDTENSDTLSTPTVIFDGASTAAGGALSITRAHGGNVYCKTMIDAGTEGGFYRLVNANVPNGAWDAARTDTEALATQDQWGLLPGWNAGDTNDIMCIFIDASANEISRYVYDDSGNSWAETSIGAMTDTVAVNNGYPDWAVTVDIANSRNVLIFWNARDLANADLQCFTITEAAITEVTNVVQNSSDDQFLAALGIDVTNDTWYAAYAGKSDGSETVNTSTQIYYKSSADHGTTWGSETAVTVRARNRRMIIMTSRFAATSFFLGTYHIADDSYFNINYDNTSTAVAGTLHPIGG